MTPNRLYSRNPIVKRLLYLALALLPLTLTAKPREVWERYKIAVIASDGESPETKAIEAGARAIAPELEDEYYLAITIDNLSPVDNTPASWEQAMNKAFLDNYNAVIVRANDSSQVADEIDFLAKNDIPVVTIGDDVNGSQRIAAITTDETDAGRLAAETFINNLRFARDKVAIVAGNLDNNPVARQRLTGAREVLAEMPDMTIDGPYASDETFGTTYPKIVSVTETDYGRNVRGWLFLGSWPLLGGQQLPWRAGTKICVAMDAGPQIIPYLATDQVQAVLATDSFAMGKLALTLLIDQINNDKAPEKDVYTVPPAVITQKNLEQFQKDWTRWLQ